MSCGGSFRGCGGGFSSSGCGGGSDMRIPISSGGCGPTSYLYVTERSSGCGSRISFTVDHGGCGGRCPASDEDIMRAFNNLRRYNQNN